MTVITIFRARIVVDVLELEQSQARAVAARAWDCSSSRVHSSENEGRHPLTDLAGCWL